MTAEKIRENRLRRMAARQGLVLHKSRERDPRGLTHGTYMLTNELTRGIVAADHATGRGYGLDLDEVEAYLTGGPDALYGREDADAKLIDYLLRDGHAHPAWHIARESGVDQDYAEEALARMAGLAPLKDGEPDPDHDPADFRGYPILHRRDLGQDVYEAIEIQESHPGWKPSVRRGPRREEGAN